MRPLSLWPNGNYRLVNSVRSATIGSAYESFSTQIF
jgi:hypothetical protein